MSWSVQMRDYFGCELTASDANRWTGELMSHFRDLTVREIDEVVRWRGARGVDKYEGKPTIAKMIEWIRMYRGRSTEDDLCRRQEWVDQIQGIKKRIFDEVDPGKRWNIMCDLTPNNIQGKNMCDALVAWAESVNLELMRPRLERMETTLQSHYEAKK